MHCVSSLQFPAVGYSLGKGKCTDSTDVGAFKSKDKVAEICGEYSLPQVSLLAAHRQSCHAPPVPAGPLSSSPAAGCGAPQPPGLGGTGPVTGHDGSSGSRLRQVFCLRNVSVTWPKYNRNNIIMLLQSLDQSQRDRGGRIQLKKFVGLSIIVTRNETCNMKKNKYKTKV